MAIIQVTFASEALCRYVNLNVIVPVEAPGQPGAPETLAAKAAKPAKFKTLYLLHGYSGCSTDFLYGSSIFQLAIQHNLAVIMPNGDNAFYLEDREKSEDYSRFVGKELVDFTRSMFRLSDKREDTFIGGMSMGGYGAMITALRYPDTFGKVMSVSGAYVALEFADQKRYIPDMNSNEDYQRKFFGDLETMRQRNVDPRFCMEELRRQGKPLPEIYFACGEQDFMIAQNRKLHQYMEENGVSHVYYEGEGAHDWNYWTPNLARALDWMVR